GRDDLEIGSGIYLSDGVVNLALLQYRGTEGSGVTEGTPKAGAHHFGFQVDDIVAVQKKIEENGGTFYFDLGSNPEQKNFERKFREPDGIIFDNSASSWVGTDDQS